MRRFLLLFVLLLGATSCHRQAHPLEVSFWYWHTPFHLTDSQISNLKRLSVTRLFVRAGTFTHSTKGVQISIPQSWEKPASFRVVLVFNFDSGLLSHFGSLDIGDTSRTMVAGVLTQAQRAADAGFKVEGVQLDIDSPTRLLPRYAQILHAVRAGLNHNDWSFSATALTDWLYSSHIREIAKEVDFLAPQFYERNVAIRLNDRATISDLRGLRHGLDRCGSLGVPFYAGLASYGRAILYDNDGKFAAIYRGLTPEDALRHPAFQFQSSIPLDENGEAANASSYVGEDKLTLLATKPGAGGKGVGYHLVFDLPTPDLVSRQEEILKGGAPGNCLGEILYRLPDDDDPFALPVGSVEASLMNRKPKAEITARVESKTSAWHTVEFGTEIHELVVKATNNGNSSTAANPNAIEVLVQLPNPGIEEIQGGDFDQVIACRLEKGSLTTCSAAFANALLLKRSQLLAGHTISSGVIRVRAAAPYKISTHCLNPGPVPAISK